MGIKRVQILVFFVLNIQFSNVKGGEYFKSDRLMFDFYSPQWVNTPNKITTDPTFSFSISWGKDMLIKNSKFSWFYGLGYDFSAIRHNINFKSLPNIDEPAREIGVRILNVPYSINRLSTQYLEIPFELRYRTQSKYPFRLYLGAKMGYMTRASYNLQEQNKDAYKRRNLNELDRLKYGVTFRVGYGLLNLYTYYGLNGLMISKRQRGINQLAFGITLMAN
tara:strand:+ start:1265 stop:1927 length:663 start_codon:yes stop_codon:yes gene_type:complete